MPTSTTGLSDAAVMQSRLLHGHNEMQSREGRVFWQVVKSIVTEPMFMLLLLACGVYLIAGQHLEALIMVVAILIVSGISVYQEYRSRNAVGALKKLSAPRATLIRNGIHVQVPSGEVVVGDLMLLAEGELVAADGLIISANDLALNESMLTGESFAVSKTPGNNSSVFKGTTLTSGSATVEVTAVGRRTMLGKIGQSLEEITVFKTPLQLQIRLFVKYMVWAGAVAFLLVVGYNYFHSHDLLASFLQGLTLAMSVLPEEIPVAFSTFMALGAFRLLKNNIIVKQPYHVETLGSATVICADKTGTITQNLMHITRLYDHDSGKSIDVGAADPLPVELIEFGMWASESAAFDPMEKAIHQLYAISTPTDKRSSYNQIHEYPIGGKPPMMTHIFQDEEGHMIIAVKGAVEAVLRQANLTQEERNTIEKQAGSYAAEGLRVLAVGKGDWKGNDYPDTQQEIPAQFLGLLAFQDPPKDNIAATIQTFREAGITVKMITGDYAETAVAIARQVNLAGNYEVVTGEDIANFSEAELRSKVKTVHIFARMYPAAKLKVINALKANGEVVAMTGDGVNDGPALKAAHIGIAMGLRGSEVAKDAASLILTDDDLGHMTDAVAQGRKIYDNLKKAVQYIVSIHIPIILLVTLPLLLWWRFTDIFSPVHVIFLELIMGPTCSIIYENEPVEPGTMQRLPRKMGSTFLSGRQLLISVIQGLMITAGCLGIGYSYLQQQVPDEVVRTVIFISLLFSNIFLTLVNRSFKFGIFTTIRYKNNMVWFIILVSLLCIAAFLYLPLLQGLFRLHALNGLDIFYCAATGFCCTFWLELLKAVRKNPG
ncbi:MAG: cation-translocating P-type ATPase [Ferruginibacter sp.]|nr:cation-translocating P-type ATPase [Ferruginibacter sp.]